MSNWDVYVDHPSHYNLPGKKECIEQMREDFGDYIVAIFCLTNAYKYLYRAGHKDDAEEDRQKAKWYYEYMQKLKFAWSDKKFSKLYKTIGRELKGIEYD